MSWWDTVDWQQPLDPDCSLNQGLRGFWVGTPNGFGGNRLTDLMNRSHGVLTNGPTWVGTPYGPWVAFDGADDLVTASVTLNPDQASWYACGLWNGGESFPRILQGSGGTIINFNGTGTTTIGFTAYTGASAFNSSNSIANGTVFFAAFVRNRAIAQYRIHLNGVVSTSGSVFGGSGGVVTQTLSIGNEPGTTRTLNGQLGAILAFDDAHSPEQSVAILGQMQRNFPDMLTRLTRKTYSIPDGGPPPTTFANILTRSLCNAGPGMALAGPGGLAT